MNTAVSRNFFEVVQASVKNMSDIESFLVKETYLNGKLFSWEGHEYQQYITRLIQNRKGLELACSKSAQLGLTELCIRVLLAKMAVHPNTHILSSYPTKAFSSEVFKIRFNPVLDASPRLSSLVQKDIDSTSVKGFVNGSIIYALAGNLTSKGVLQSRPIDTIFIDELDKQESSVFNSYSSRTIHTPEDKRLTIKISTPTIDNYGISLEMQQCSELHVPHMVCESCGCSFVPSFYEHVRVPGFDKPMLDFQRSDLAKSNPYKAYLECPDCKAPLVKRKYEWKVEYKDNGTPNKVGVKLHPFIAPYIPISDLVIDSVKFDSVSEFRNQRLGESYSEKNSQISREDIHFEHTDRTHGLTVAGIDWGKTVWITIMVVRQDTSIHVTETHAIPLPEFREFFKALNSRITFASMVCDSLPFVELVYTLIQEYPRLFSAAYVDPTIPRSELYTMVSHDKLNQEVRRLDISKTLAFDHFAACLRGMITFEPSPHQETIVQHLTSMKRVHDYERQSSEGDTRFKWVKASGSAEDHLHHSSLFALIASKLAMTDMFYAPPLDFSIRKINPTALNARQQHGNRLP